MHTTRNPGRVAGLWYLLIIALGPFYLVYIPGRLFVKGDPAATVTNIAANEWLFRVGMIAELFCGVILILLVLALYRLFKDVDWYLAALVVILGGVLQAAISFVSVVSDAGALRVVTDSQFLSAFGRAERDALVLLLLQLHHYQITASLLLSGAWLFPLGILVYKSRLLPRFLGVWLLVAGIAWIGLFLTGMLLPQYQDAVFSFGQPAFLGEVAFMLWLLVKGAKLPGALAAEPSRVIPG